MILKFYGYIIPKPSSSLHFLLSTRALSRQLLVNILHDLLEFFPLIAVQSYSFLGRQLLAVFLVVLPQVYIDLVFECADSNSLVVAERPEGIALVVSLADGGLKQFLAFVTLAPL